LSFGDERKINSVDEFIKDIGLYKNSPKTIEKKLHSFASSEFLKTMIDEKLQTKDRNTTDNFNVVINPFNIVVFDSDEACLSVRLALPNEGQQKFYEWHGQKHYVCMTKGEAKYTPFFVPPNQNINTFNKNVVLKKGEPIELISGVVLYSENQYQFNEISDVREPTILYELTIKNSETELFWVFDSNLTSIFAKVSGLGISRIRNICLLLNEMDEKLSITLLDKILSSKSPTVKLTIAFGLLTSKNPNVFYFLEKLQNSTDDILAKRARHLSSQLLK
jgi:hypothetical protein